MAYCGTQIFVLIYIIFPLNYSGLIMLKLYRNMRLNKNPILLYETIYVLIVFWVLRRAFKCIYMGTVYVAINLWLGSFRRVLVFINIF